MSSSSSSSSSSGNGSSNSIRDNGNMASSKSVNSNSVSSSNNSISTNNSNINNTSNTTNSGGNNSNSNIVVGGARSGTDFFSTFISNRPKLIRTPGADMSQKIAYNSGKEIPFDHDESKEMTVYSNGRNRKVYYGINGAPYYITDTGNLHPLFQVNSFK